MAAQRVAKIERGNLEMLQSLHESLGAVLDPRPRGVPKSARVQRRASRALRIVATLNGLQDNTFFTLNRFGFVRTRRGGGAKLLAALFTTQSQPGRIAKH